jgi:hypothetical protein
MAIIEPTILLRSSEFAWLYESHPGFKILDDDLFDHDLLEVIGVQQGSPTHEQLLAWQRLLRIHPEESIAAVLYEDGLRSANAIARLPQEHFVARYAGRLAGSVTGPAAEELTREIHQRAAAVSAKIAHASADVIGMLSAQVRHAPFGNAAPELTAARSAISSA